MLSYGNIPDYVTELTLKFSKKLNNMIYPETLPKSFLKC